MVTIDDFSIADMQYVLREKEDEDIGAHARKLLKRRFMRKFKRSVMADYFYRRLEHKRRQELLSSRPRLHTESGEERHQPLGGEVFTTCGNLSNCSTLSCDELSCYAITDTCDAHFPSNDDELTEACTQSVGGMEFGAEDMKDVEELTEACTESFEGTELGADEMKDVDELTEASLQAFEGMELGIEEMKDLLSILVPRTFEGSVQDLTCETWSDKASIIVQAAFKQRFGHLSKIELRKLKQNPTYLPQEMVRIHSLVADFNEELKIKRSELKTLVDNGSKKRRQASMAIARFQKRCLGDAVPILDRIAAELGQKATKLAHDGNSTYAEPTHGGLLKIANAMRPLLGKNLDGHVLLDCGSGVGTALWTLCQALGVKGIGIECSENRVYSGSAATGPLLKEFKGNKTLQHKVANSYGDLLNLQSLPSCVTVAYQFDEAFPPKLMEKLLDLYLHAPLTLRFIIASKPQKESKYAGIFAKYGLYPLKATIPCSKIVSSESCYFTIYGRRCCDYSDLEVFPPPVEQVKDDMEAPTTIVHAGTSLSPSMEMIMSGDVEAAIRYYADLEVAMEKVMNVARHRKQRDDGPCTAAEAMEHCRRSTCEACEAAFRHVDIDTLYSANVLWLPCQKGLFTAKTLPSGTFVVQYTGKTSPSVIGDRYVLQLSNSCYIDAKGCGIHQFVNHSCDPNCTFTKWLDIQGNSSVSIVTLRVIKANEELTVDYGTSREAFICQCPACKPCNKTALLLGMTNLSDAYISKTIEMKPSLTVKKMCQGMLKMPHVGQQLRDSLRIRALQLLGWRTVTVSLENGDGFATSHLRHHWNRNPLLKTLESMGILLDVIELDYLWMPQGYTFNRFPRSFFEFQLPALADFIRVGGSMLLPAQVSFLDNLMLTKAAWSPFYELRLLDADARARLSPLFAAYQKLQQEVGKKNVDLALSKNDAGNTLLYTTMTRQHLRDASAASATFIKGVALPVCLFQLVRKDTHRRGRR